MIGSQDSAVRRLVVETDIDIDNLILLIITERASQNHKLVEKVKQNYDLNIIRKVEEKDPQGIRLRPLYNRRDVILKHETSALVSASKMPTVFEVIQRLMQLYRKLIVYNM
jgi:delta-aminolevulinic acid dehydratase/porphobilinogen synthase